MENISGSGKIRARELAYFRQRLKNRVFGEMTAFFAEEAERSGITKRVLVDKLNRDPAQITRWLMVPSNLTLETISDLLLALEAEVDCRIVRFADRPKANEIHPYVASVRGEEASQTNISRRHSSVTGTSATPAISLRPLGKAA